MKGPFQVLKVFLYKEISLTYPENVTIFLGVYEGMMHTNVQRKLRKLSLQTFQEHKVRAGLT